MQDQILGELKIAFEKILEHLKKELAGIRTGRAHSSLVEDIAVESYGAKMPLKQLASVSIPEPRVIVISPWDKNAIKDIQRAIETALNMGVQNDGNIIRVSLPTLTEESRKELVKVVGKKLEEARVSMRAIRHEEIDKLEKTSLSEEEVESIKKKIQDEVDKFNSDSKKMADDKEEEVMKV